MTMAWDTDEGRAALEVAISHGYNIGGVLPRILTQPMSNTTQVASSRGPKEQLAVEVDRRFAGMEPIPLAPINPGGPQLQPIPNARVGAGADFEALANNYGAAPSQFTPPAVEPQVSWSGQPEKIGSQYKFNTPNGVMYSSVPRLPGQPAPHTAAPHPQVDGFAPRVTPPHVGDAGIPLESNLPLTNPNSPVLPVQVPDVVHGGQATLQPDQLNAIRSVFPEAEWNTAQLIAAAESKGNNAATGNAGEVGLFQIHPINWPSLSAALGIPINAQSLQDPYINAKAAFILWQGAQGWGRKSGTPWTTAPAVFQYLGGA